MSNESIIAIVRSKHKHARLNFIDGKGWRIIVDPAGRNMTYPERCRQISGWRKTPESAWLEATKGGAA